MIERISVKNIKGYDGTGRSIDLNLKPNKYNICCAPNGFGKTSFATALRLLTEKSNKLIVPKEYAYKNDETLQGEVTMTIDGIDYTSNSDKNEIAKNIICCVINSKVDVTTTQQNRGKYTHVEGNLDIADIVVYNNIPKVIKIEYKYHKLKQSFGTNGKFLKNRTDLFKSYRFLSMCISDEVRNTLNHISSTVDPKRSIDNAIRKINLIENKTANKIKEVIDSDDSILSKELFEYADIKNLTESFSPLIGDSLVISDKFDFIWQLIHFWENNKHNLAKVVKRMEYVAFKQRLKDMLDNVNNTWLSLKIEEDKDNLVVRFPFATQISNGQRDSLTFIVDLIKAEMICEKFKNKKIFILIDEVFDYLDDANLIVAQYYLSEFMNLKRDDIYLCMLTHLSQHTFRSYIFNDKKVNFVYLEKGGPVNKNEFVAFISYRESLNKKDPVHKQQYDDLSTFLFHYHPGKKDLTTYLSGVRIPNFKTTWGKSDVLKEAMINEVNTYLSGASDYDPYGVCMALRQKVEKFMYDSLQSDEEKSEFLKIHTTKDKLAKCNDLGMDFPEIYNLVTCFHSEADHVKQDKETLRILEKPIVYKLQHPLIKSIIARIFEYKDSPLTLECII